MQEAGVAPFAGAWIEIPYYTSGRYVDMVAPFAGAWIEISSSALITASYASLPSRERGLKYNTMNKNYQSIMSLPSRERGLKFPATLIHQCLLRRSLRGSVD